VHVRLIDPGVAKDLFDRLQGRTEQVLTKVFSTGASDGGAEIDTLEKVIDFYGGLNSRRQIALGMFACSAETTDCTSIGGPIYRDKSAKTLCEMLEIEITFLVLRLEFLHKVVDKPLVEILPSQGHVRQRP
jgi:hypothetical protein